MKVDLSNKNGYLNAFALAFFMLSGLLKSFSQFIPGPFVDVTLLSALVLLVCLVFNKRDRINLNPNSVIMLYTMFAITAFILLSLIYTHSSNYGYYKAVIWVTCLLGFIFPLFNYVNVRFLCFSLISSSILLSLVHSFIFSFFDLSLLSVELKYVVYGVYLDLGYFLGVSLFLCFFVYKYSVSTAERLFLIILGIVSLFMLFSSGARGPFLFALLLSFLYFLFCFMLNNKFRVKFLLFSVPLLVVGALFFLSAFNFGFDVDIELGRQLSRSINRLLLIFSEDRGNSVNARIGYLVDSAYYINTNPFVGYGYGSYGIITTGIDQKAFPHNMFLEAWFELGLLGFFCLVLFVFNSLFISAKVHSLFILNLFILANQMKSSNLSDSRVYFTLIGLICFFVIYDKFRCDQDK